MVLEDLALRVQSVAERSVNWIVSGRPEMRKIEKGSYNVFY
jgi:hypothetical protein